MSNKSWDKIAPLDRELRQAFPAAMMHGTRVLIRMVVGFELFNTRPYHNYETWSEGYEATDGRVYAREEDLDDCLRTLATFAKLTDEELKPWQRAPKDLSGWLGFAVADK